MNNRVIRQLIFTNCLLKRDVAERIGISLFTFSHWLQSEMTDTQRNRTEGNRRTNHHHGRIRLWQKRKIIIRIGM